MDEFRSWCERNGGQIEYGYVAEFENGSVAMDKSGVQVVINDDEPHVWRGTDVSFGTEGLDDMLWFEGRPDDYPSEPKEQVGVQASDGRIEVGYT